MAHHWYDALPVCRLFCIIGDWSPNSSHCKVLRKRNLIKRVTSNSLRFAWLTWHIWDSTLRCIAFHLPKRHFHTAMSWPFPAMLPSWHHPHQTPSLRPFRANLVVILQVQFRQGGVLFEAFSQSLAVDTWLEKHDEAHSTHDTANMRTSPCSSSHL